MLSSILGIGLVAGTVTTLAGAGGGVFLILALSLFVGPHVALAASAPTLLVGNLHRVVLYRREVDRTIAFRVIQGALPASLVAGALSVSLPTWFLHGLFGVVTVYAAVRATGRAKWTPPPGALLPVGAFVGAISAASGGAGLLLAPMLLACGLTEKRYVATGAAIALATHVGRLAGYGSRGILTREVLLWSALATVAVVAGNFVGDAVRPHVTGRRATWVENGVLAVCTGLAALGLTH